MGKNIKKYEKITNIVNNYIIKEKNSDALVVESQKGVFIENINWLKNIQIVSNPYRIVAKRCQVFSYPHCYPQDLWKT